LLTNVSKHTLVPEHQVLSNEGKKMLLAQYHLNETQVVFRLNYYFLMLTNDSYIL